MRVTRLLHVLLLLSSAVASADPALVARINEIERALETARTSLPKPIESDDIGDYLQQLAYQIRPMASALAAAKGGLHPSLQEEGKLYDKMMADLKAVETLEARVELLLAPANDFVAVVVKHKKGQPADAELAKLDATIATTANGTKGDAWAAPHVAAFQKFAARLRTANGDVAKKAATVAAEKVASDQASATKRLHDETRVAAEKLVKAGIAGTAITDDELAKLDVDLARIEEQTPGGGFFVRATIAAARVVQRWQRPNSEKELATLFGTMLAAQGKSSGKQLGLKIAAEPQRCYLVLGMFAAQADDARVAGFHWQLPRGEQVQEFHIRPFVGLAEGFCTLDRRQTVTAQAELSFQGTKNVMRYAVLTFDRDHLPAQLSAAFVLERGDHCDPHYWEQIWTHPIAGTLAYAGREPVIMLGEGEAIRLNDPSATSAPGKLSSKPSGGIRFEPGELEWGAGCPTNQKEWLPAKSATSLQIVACYERVQKKYGGTWDHIERQRGAARDMGGIAPAVESRATDVMKQQDKDGAACNAIDEGMHKKLAKLNETLIDRFLQKPPADTTGRADAFARATTLRGY